MTTSQDIETGFNAVVTGINNVKAIIGPGATPLNQLTTTDKTNIINAMNEIKLAADNAASSGGAQIDDGSENNVNVWSGSKISSELSALSASVIAQIVNGAPEAADAMNELYAFIQSNEGSIVTMLAEQSKRVAVNQSQSFSAAEKVQGNANLGSLSLVQFGPVDTDYAAIVNAGLI